MDYRYCIEISLMKERVFPDNLLHSQQLLKIINIGMATRGTYLSMEEGPILFQHSSTFKDTEDYAACGVRL